MCLLTAGAAERRLRACNQHLWASLCTFHSAFRPPAATRNGSAAIPPRHRSPSQVDDDPFDRLRAADQDVSVGWWFERLRVVADRAGEQGCFTGVADARTARPAGRYVACLGESQHARVLRIPAGCDGAAGEGHLGTAAARPGRLMWELRRCSRDP